MNPEVSDVPLYPRPRGIDVFCEEMATFIASVGGTDLYRIKSTFESIVLIGRVTSRRSEGYDRAGYYLTDRGAKIIGHPAQQFLKAYVQLMQ